MSEDKTLGQDMTTDQPESEPTQETKSDNNIGELVYEAKKHRQDKAKLREENASLKAQLKDIDEAQLKEKEQYKELSERLSQERDQYKVKADEYDNFQSEMRSNLMERLSDEQKEIASDLPLAKLQKFVDMNVKAKPVATQESASTKMSLEKDAFKDMDKNERRQNWKTIVDNYRNS
tara:strand:- start:1399 stop:1929 length:531 start_codon:yes stop_codon:yes gene_type:complete